MRTFNTPAQARSLREIEAAAMSPAIKTIPEIDANPQVLREQPVCEAENPEAKEEGQAEETQTPAKKSRKKKNTKTV